MATLAASRAHPNSGNSSSLDEDYIAALASANRFLQAWQTHDQETGLVLLSDGVKQPTSVQNLESFFSGQSRTAYEIVRGKKLKTGRYIFPVALFARPGGKDSRWTHPRHSQIVVIRAGKEDWAIDRLP